MSVSAAQCRLPNRAGIGLKLSQMEQFLKLRPSIGFVEVHAENYMVEGGIRLAQLEAVRQDYPLSIHGVAASLGGEADLDPQHLKRLKQLLDRFQPLQFSEHLAWSSHAGIFYNDLLPLAYTQSSLERVVEHIDQLQSYLGRQVLLENPSNYLTLSASMIPETEFITEVIRRSGCGLLLDLTNVLVSCTNQGSDPFGYIDALPLQRAAEVHLAGFSEEVSPNGERLLIDSHNRDVAPQVWQLYQAALSETGPIPTLIERDSDLPPLESLIDEANLAEICMQRTSVYDAG